ncbi:RraA family protein [Peribacillus cavernae]|uniref:Putative 4-hydroxy-4-methyl-2-oxoglutarate aldolase n=1 Tax=Peribacillus cavernae TaxID=1674310 RepID=A0A433HRR4_9BACI|nr:RraA family protein [Peribacillus cavernae]MDQ0218753.1 4-hydroxy-4-methyl-2-oxoglutarate aldolase [Peribacillus cavernae]RUQ30965.1 RraA family protein [Peribacillus cavernae]
MMEGKKMVGHTGFGYIETIDRPCAELINNLTMMDSANVTDAQNRTGAMDRGIKPLDQGKRIFGTAITVELPLGDNLMLYKALDLAQPGDVLVVYTNGNFNKAIWGELMTKSAMLLKVGGLVVDGLIRDRQANRNHDFPIFCRGTTSVSVEKNGPGFVNGEIPCGGTVVRPGDIIIGDDDGVVVVKKENLSMVIENLKQIEQREITRSQEIANGQALPKWFAQLMAEKGLLPGMNREDTRIGKK